jgi:ABC-type antimicrobial peptide transport system permease subunit
VVGVVQDLRAGGVETSATSDLYRCSYQSPWFDGILVRTSGDPIKLVPQMESLVRSLDRRVPVESVHTLDDLLNDLAADNRLLGKLLTFFAGLAFTLAVVGIYGVIAYTTAQRTHEFGLRMALGAEKSDIASLVLTWGGKLALAGTALGLGLAWWLTRLMASLLEGVSPTDPAIFAAMPLVIVAVALLACWIPARRATKVDPMSALRYE